ncbi:hypothetical protein Blue_054 [Bacillus phage Deep Blue]|uniref:Uncharacterized protein n=1 Tax=Bacillus phage Deep Blue TaxID=1792245 RepID=A0A140HLL5_9CAUD|nr:hypothetical protein Blue_054 [Bacillus phage Deep Blue]AMO25877.1 hypothetical protein Blue_054 [Bacillus phage Deep Blue]
MRIYSTTSEYKDNYRTDNVLYVGTDLKKAQAAGDQIFVWIEGLHVQTLKKSKFNNVTTWKIAYDRLNMLRGEIIQKQDELNSLQKVLKTVEN